ncbi:DNA polymerase II [Spongorhabdus nitratireducens]
MNTSPIIENGFLLSRHSYDCKHNINQDFKDKSSTDQSYTKIVLWVMTAHQPARLVIEQERPVFFIATSNLTKAAKLLKQSAIPVYHRSLELQTFDQQQVTALYFDTIRHARNAANILKTSSITCYESDIRLHDRFLMERFITGGLSFTAETIEQHQGYIEYRQVRVRPDSFTPSFKVISLDIECSEQGSLYSIGLHGPDTAEVLMIGDPEPERDDINCDIHWVQGEKQLLQSLVDRITQLDPDIIIGWNVINFDFRLLVKRAKHRGIKLLLGRGQQEAHWRDRRDESEQGFITLPGRMVIDGIDALKAATWHFDSFSLEHVSQVLLNRGKATEDVDNRMEAITHDFHHNKQKLAKYNIEDCRLVSDIFEHTHLLDFLRLRSQLTGLELDRQGGSVQAFTNLYLPKLHRAGYIAPNLPQSGGLTSPGGYVMDSFPGLYHNVLVLDFKSLYPSIIRTFKIDPMGLIEGLKQSDDSIPGYRGAVFSRDQHFLPDIISSLWQQRDKAKQLGDSACSQAIKILMNSFYGVLGSGGCRFYDPRLASSITMRGHDIMKQTAQWIEQAGHKVIYGDTDSTFVLLNKELDHNQADCIGTALAADINRRWEETLQKEYQLECHLELEYETHYSRFLMPTIRGSETGSKKRYAGLKVDAKGETLVFKGLETVRSDWTLLAKSFQTSLYQQVFADQSPEALVRETVQQTLAGQKDNQLIYRKRLRQRLDQYVKNIPPHVRAARRADELNQQAGKPLRYQNKGWISYIITVNGPEAVEHCSSPADYQHYIDKQLKPVADAILPFADLDFDQLIDGQLGLF